jgi:hypothetical protein
MIKKKAKKSATTKKIAKKKTKQKKQKDAAQVHQDISAIVKSAAREITEAVVVHAIQGELGSAKYLLEMAGVYPKTTDGSQATAEEDCLAKTLLDRLGPPVKVGDNSQASKSASESSSGTSADSNVDAESLNHGDRGEVAENTEG